MSTPQSNQKGIYVVIAAYNEERVISDVLQLFDSRIYKVVVVDDGSSDKTREEVKKYPVVLLCHAVNLGQGASIQTGLNYCLQQNDVGFIVTFDADGQHFVDDIEKLIVPLASGEFDVALGSRFLKRGSVIDLPKQREMVLRLAIWLTKWTTGLKLTDTHNGLRAFTSEAAKQIRITQNRMAHASEILSQIAALKLRYIEIPVRIKYDAYSLSKGQRLANGINILWEMLEGMLK